MTHEQAEKALALLERIALSCERAEAALAPAPTAAPARPIVIARKGRGGKAGQ